MLLKSTVATAALALAGSVMTATPAHATDVVRCAATAPSGHTRAYCTFYGVPGQHKVTITSSGVRYAWARATCGSGATATEVFADVWNTDGGYDEETGFLSGGVCLLTVAAGAGTGTTPGHATGVVYHVV